MSFKLPSCARVKSQQHQQAVPMIQQSGSAAGHVMPSQPQIPVSQNTSDQMVGQQHNPTLTSDWIVQFREKDGKRFYHNIRTGKSTWHKPLELMPTLNERADCTTDWREVETEDETPKYYYNVVTKISTWTMPDEIQLARSKFNMESSKGVKVPSSKENSDIRVEDDVRTKVISSSAQENNAPTSGSTVLPVSLNINAPDTVEIASDVKQKIVKEDIQNVQDSKTAFRELLESVNVRSDWTWNQAMKLIINDKRYAALRPHMQRIKTFDEFLKEKKKQEEADRRARQKRARENFKKMLKESKELTASTRWREAIAIFEHDERFMAIERAEDREDMLLAYREQLREKLLKQKREEYREYLKSCDFIKSSSKWRDVQHRVEADKRCSSLDILERSNIFLDHLYDLEKEEEVQRRLRMEETQIFERKNRHEFRKLMEEHIAAGKLNAKTCWSDFYMKVKESPAYLALSSNKSGATAKDLFEDAVDDLHKKYSEARSKITIAEKLGKFTMSSRWMFKDFKAAVSANFSSQEVSENNLKIIYEELKIKAKDREAKEAESRRHLVDDFYEFLCGLKEITTSSRWEDCKLLFEERFGNKEGILRETFNNYVLELKENEREKKKSRREKKIRNEKKKRKEEHRRKEKAKRKEKERKEKDRAKRVEELSDSSEHDDAYSRKKHKKKSQKEDRIHKKRHRSSTDTPGEDYEKRRHRHKRHKKCQENDN